MSDIEKIVNEEHTPSKWKSLVSALGLAVLIMLGKWEAAAQTSTSRDQILNQIEHTLNHKWPWDYKELLNQRDALLKSYNSSEDVMDKFVSTQKRDFERAYANNEYGIKDKIKTISIILENDFGVDTQWKTPVQIVTIALEVIANEDTMLWMKEFTWNLSGEFDLPFMNAIGYIQSKNPNTWVKVWNTIMPNWELDGTAGRNTLEAMIKILNDWSFTVDFSDVNLGNNFVPNKPSTTPSKPSITNEESVDDTSNSTTTVNNSSNSTNTNNSANTPNISQDNNSSMIDLDDLDDVDDGIVTEPQRDNKVEPDTSNNVDNWLNPIDQNGQNNWSKNNNKKEDIQENSHNNDEINLDDYSFEDPVADIVEGMNWDSDILAQHLDKSKLVDISYQDIISTVNWFLNDNLKKTVMYYLLSDDVIHAQEIMWMSPDCDSRYPNFVAKDKLDKDVLKKMKELWKIRRFDSPDEVLNNENIPQKVKEVFSDILEWKIKTNGKPYSIVSKDDYRIYMFSWDNHLLSRQPVLVWADQWDQKNNVKQWVQTTPGGVYRVGQRYENYLWKDFFVNYGSHYIILVPEDGQYDLTNQYSMWVHGDYKWERSRKHDLYSQNSIDHRTTNWCINVDSGLFGEIYNHFELWALIYVTPDN